MRTVPPASSVMLDGNGITQPDAYNTRIPLSDVRGRMGCGY